MKRRTGLLFSSAVVLGLVGGAVGGFLIQQARPATPLPPFQRTLAAAAGPGIADPHDATTDDGTKLDGDLRAVLLATPAGAKDTTDFAPREWFGIADLAEYYRDSSNTLTLLNAEGFRRAVRTGWTLADGTRVEIDLVQFRTVTGAKSYTASTYTPVDPNAPVIAGTATGAVSSPGQKDSDGLYTAYGLVRHGELVEQVFVSRAKSAPSTDEVAAVTKDQAGLL
ncbi:hypothetical protein ABH935_008097 [Catenulispora sp. GAS73]|uniref:hypothetical protein n=1 Tax=Catenulispora sp. GAS73 TaxID=3156269 RepID=UPI003510E574